MSRNYIYSFVAFVLEELSIYGNIIYHCFLQLQTTLEIWRQIKRTVSESRMLCPNPGGSGKFDCSFVFIYNMLALTYLKLNVRARRN